MATAQGSKLVEMNWDPVTRIVGSLGIYTKIDFGKREVAECHSTSSIFRGYSIFKGKDPRDMKAVNPIEGEFYREALQVSRYTREMFCLMEGRHVHPSTLYPGGVGTTATIQLFTDYLTRLMRYCEFLKRAVPMHDDLFDFLYEALPGYEEVGRRRVLLGCWGSFQNPDYCNFEYRDMTSWGRKMFVTPGIVVDGELVTTDLVAINLGIRILLGSSFYEDWEGQEQFVTHDPLGNPVDRRHPWNQHTNPAPNDLFGEAARWGDTLKPFLWTHASTVVPGFAGTTEVELPVTVTYDLEVAAGKYFHALEDGHVPALFLFSGTLFAEGPNGLRVHQVPWDREASYRLPVRVWRELMDAYFPGAGWLRLRRDTLDRLQEAKVRRALATWDDVVVALLRDAGEAA